MSPCFSSPWNTPFLSVAVLAVVSVISWLLPGNDSAWGHPRRRWAFFAILGALVEGGLVCALLVFPHHAARIPQASRWFYFLWMTVNAGLLVNANTAFWLVHSIDESTTLRRMVKGILIGIVAAMTWEGFYLAHYYFRYAIPGPALPDYLPFT